MKSTHRIAAVPVGRRRTAHRGARSRPFRGLRRDSEFDPFGFGPGRSRFDPRSTLVLSMFRPTITPRRAAAP
jgi:hypothetical protein